MSSDTLSRIAADAASMTISRTGSTTSVSIRGLGATSGHALMRLGEIMLQALESSVIQLRLLRIATTVRSEGPGRRNWPRSHVKRLLEYQRIRVYPPRVRSKAWDLIFMILAKGGWKQIVAAVREWPEVEIQLFLRQLLVCAESRWSLHPVKNRRGVALASQDETLDAVFCTSIALLFSNIAMDLAASSSETQFPIPMSRYGALLTYGAQIDNPTYLHVVLGPWISWEDIQRSVVGLPTIRLSDLCHSIPAMLSAHPEVADMVMLICNTPQDVIDFVARSITQAVGRLQTDSDPQNAYPLIAIEADKHPLWLYLGWAACLAYTSPAFSAAFLQYGFHDAIEDLGWYDMWDRWNLRTVVRAQITTYQELLLTMVCHMALSAIHTHHPFQSNVQKQLGQDLRKYVLNPE